MTGKVGAVRRGVPIIHPDDVQDDPRDAEIERLRATLTGRQRYIHAELHVDEHGPPDGVWTDCERPTCAGTREALAAAPPPPAPAPSTPYLSCDACGQQITDDYMGTLVEGDTGQYHVRCLPPKMPYRIALLDPPTSVPAPRTPEATDA